MNPFRTLRGPEVRGGSGGYGVEVGVLSRRSVLALAGALLALCTPRLSDAQASAVPAELQAELLSKLASYDRKFAARAGDTVRVLILVKPDSPKSQVSAAEMRGALAQLERIGGLPHIEGIVPYQDPDAVASRCRSEHVAVVYLTPGFDDDIPRLAAALNGVDVLTLAAVPDYVPQGVVLGFDIESGRPKLLINLEQAKRQNVNFPADVLRLMRVYR
jgi:hypothetical protein